MNLIACWMRIGEAIESTFEYYNSNKEQMEQELEQISQDIDWEVKNSAIKLFSQFYQFDDCLSASHYRMKVEIANSFQLHLHLIRLVRLFNPTCFQIIHPYH